MAGEPFTNVSRLSLNQYTTHEWTLREAVEGCRRAGLDWIGLWRDKIHECGLSDSAKILKDNNVRVSGICRGGWFPALTAKERQEKIDDNFKAIDECKALDCDTLILVCGGSPDKDITEARKQVADGIATIVDHAVANGVKLGIEPLHPMFAADRSVINTTGQSLDIAEAVGSSQIGVILDVYHIWWDPELYPQIERARGRIFGYHVNDWLVPTPDLLMGRGMMGDGVIELRKIRKAVEEAGYDGPIECEIFNRAIWDAPGDEIVRTMCQRFIDHC